jgi:hypothetical protein
MSIFGTMNCAISGLPSQSDAFGTLGNIIENVASSQTEGFECVGTSVVGFLTAGTPTATNTSGNPLTDAVNSNGAGLLNSTINMKQ